MSSKIVKVGNVIEPPQIYYKGDKRKIPVLKIQKFRVVGNPLTKDQLKNILNAKFPPNKREAGYLFQVRANFSDIGWGTSPSVEQHEEIRLWSNQEYDIDEEEGTIDEFEIQYIKRS